VYNILNEVKVTPKLKSELSCGTTNWLTVGGRQLRFQMLICYFPCEI
jgi:hypothetical protein